MRVLGGDRGTSRLSLGKLSLSLCGMQFNYESKQAFVTFGLQVQKFVIELKDVECAMCMKITDTTGLVILNLPQGTIKFLFS